MLKERLICSLIFLGSAIAFLIAQAIVFFPEAPVLMAMGKIAPITILAVLLSSLFSTKYLKEGALNHPTHTGYFAGGLVFGFSYLLLLLYWAVVFSYKLITESYSGLYSEYVGYSFSTLIGVSLTFFPLSLVFGAIGGFIYYWNVQYRHQKQKV